MINILRLILLILTFHVGYGQIEDSVHLSYNLHESDNDLKKIINKDGSFHFFINKEYFKTNTLDSILNKTEIQNIDIICIDDFKFLALKERERQIKEGEKINSIRILMNDEVFNKIYLYEKNQDNTVNRYLVTWVEEIE